MPKLKINKETISKSFNSLILFLAEETFLTFIILTFIIFFISGIFFYFNAYLPSQEIPEVEVKMISIDEDLYRSFVSVHLARKEKFYSISKQEVFDPFYSY